MRQASRRSWRIGQTEPVQVVFMVYRNTLQADALTLVAQKLQSSLAVEGELPEDGLAAYGAVRRTPRSRLRCRHVRLSALSTQGVGGAVPHAERAHPN